MICTLAFISMVLCGAKGLSTANPTTVATEAMEATLSAALIYTTASDTTRNSSAALNTTNTSSVIENATTTLSVLDNVTTTPSVLENTTTTGVATITARVATTTTRVATTTTRVSTTTTHVERPVILCYQYNWFFCKTKMDSTKLPRHLIPICYGKVVPCYGIDEYCKIIFGRLMWKNITGSWADWHGGVAIAGCTNLPERTPNPEGGWYNDGKCDFTAPSGGGKFSTCFCQGNLCNNFHDKEMLNGIYHKDSPVAVGTEEPGEPEVTEQPELSDRLVVTVNREVVAAVVTSTVWILILLVVAYLIRRLGLLSHSSKPNHVDVELSSTENTSASTSYDDNDINLVLDLSTQTLLNQGRFGKLYLIHEQFRGHQCVVKVSQPQHASRWAQEREIYQHPGLQHDNILKYLGAIDQETQLLLLIEYHSNGSLQDYLKGHTLRWDEMLTIMHSMMKGLAHLHQPIVLPSHQTKFPIAHRDLKSCNIILDEQLTAKIADFNLSQILYNSILADDPKLRIGTVRYMAPEMLNGPIEYTRAAVLQTDVYAACLILWEIFSRYELSLSGLSMYKPPYHEHVGDSPTIVDMCNIVYTQGLRPHFSSDHDNTVIAELISTIKEGWDEEGNARLTAQCIESRIHDTLIRNKYKPTNEMSQPCTNNNNTQHVQPRNPTTYKNLTNSAVKMNGTAKTKETTKTGNGTAKTSSPHSLANGVSGYKNNGFCHTETAGELTTPI